MTAVSTSDKSWQFWIDRGGTFTDIVARRPDGQLVIHKLLSENPERYTDAPIQGIREILGIPTDAPILGEQIEVVKMGTTVATNALLERKGDRTVLVITKGFCDSLRIGYQNRPDIFARQIILPEMILSGPAGGIVGAVQTSALAKLSEGIANFHKIISFDMGGTSTDVAHYNGEDTMQTSAALPLVQCHPPAKRWRKKGCC